MSIDEHLEKVCKSIDKMIDPKDYLSAEGELEVLDKLLYHSQQLQEIRCNYMIASAKLGTTNKG